MMWREGLWECCPCLLWQGEDYSFNNLLQSSSIAFSSSTLVALNIAIRVCLKSGIPLKIGLEARCLLV